MFDFIEIYVEAKALVFFGHSLTFDDFMNSDGYWYITYNLIHLIVVYNIRTYYIISYILCISYMHMALSMYEHTCQICSVRVFVCLVKMHIPTSNVNILNVASVFASINHHSHLRCVSPPWSLKASSLPLKNGWDWKTISFSFGMGHLRPIFRANFDLGGVEMLATQQGNA